MTEPAIMRVDYGPITEARRQAVHLHMRCVCGGHHEVVFDKRTNEPIPFSEFIGDLVDAVNGCSKCPEQHAPYDLQGLLESAQRNANQSALSQQMAQQVTGSLAAMPPSLDPANAEPPKDPQ